MSIFLSMLRSLKIRIFEKYYSGGGTSKLFLEKLFEYADGSVQTGFALRECNYCGKHYIKLQNKTLYCSHDCRVKSTQDNKARYQRRRRQAIRNGELITNENEKLGTTYFPEHNCNWEKERELVKKAKRNAGII